MNNLRALFTAAILSGATLTGAGAAAAAPFIPADADMAMIEAGVASRLLDQDSAVLSDVIATEDKEVPDLVWVCGKVKGKNTFGGYAQPVPFMGTLVTEKNGQKLFLVISVSGPSDAEQSAVLNTCLSKFK